MGSDFKYQKCFPFSLKRCPTMVPCGIERVAATIFASLFVLWYAKDTPHTVRVSTPTTTIRDVSTTAGVFFFFAEKSNGIKNTTLRRPESKLHKSPLDKTRMAAAEKLGLCLLVLNLSIFFPLSHTIVQLMRIIQIYAWHLWPLFCCPLV